MYNKVVIYNQDKKINRILEYYSVIDNIFILKLF